MMIYVFDRVENIVGKGENAHNQHFLLFPQSGNASFMGFLKVRIMWYRVKHNKSVMKTLSWTKQFLDTPLIC